MTKVILLVEDNRSDEKLAALALGKCGVENEIVVARDGADAIDYLFGTGKHIDRATSAMPSLVLLDLKLPRIGGLEVLKRIRSDPRTKPLPVVVLTGSKQEEDVIASYALCANAYVRKPLDFAEFREATRTLGVFWLRFNQPPPID